VGVGALVGGFAGQIHRRHDSSDRILIAKDAPVGQQPEAPRLRVVRHSPAWAFLVLYVSRNGSASLKFFPNRAVIPGMNLEGTVIFGLGEERVVYDQFAVDQPNNAHLGFWRESQWLAPLALMAGFHWHHRSIRFTCDLGERKRGILSQFGRERSSPNGHRLLFVIDHAG
jgi:hypothetical protein